MGVPQDAPDLQPVSALRDAKDAVVWKPDTTGTRVLTQNTANQITDILRDVLTEGPASGTSTMKALAGRGLAGMPGTSDLNHAAWFDGYSPDLVTAVSLSRLDTDGKAAKLISSNQQGVVYGSIDAAPILAALFTK